MRFCAELSPGFGGHSEMGTSISAYLRMEVPDRVLPFTYFRPRGSAPVDDDPADPGENIEELLPDLEVQEEQ